MENLSPELEKFRPSEEEFFKGLQSNIENHDQDSDGFTALEYDPVKYPFQRIDCRHWKGTNANQQQLLDTASLIIPSANEVIEFLIEERFDLINHASDKLETDGKLKLVTNHEDVIGVMVLGGALLCAMYEKDLLEETDINTAIFISDFIKTTDFRGFGPTVHVLGELVSDTIFSQPPTKSLSKAGIPEEVTSEVNSVARQVHKELEDDDKPLFTIYAGSGTTDEFVKGGINKKKNPSVIHMGPISNGSKKLNASSWVLPAGINLSDRESPRYFFGHMRTPRHTSVDQHVVMHDIEEGMQEATGIQHQYHSDADSFNDIKNLD